MFRTASVVLLTAFVTLVAPPASAQRQDPTPAQREAIQKLDNWFGEWEGSGWSQRGPQTREEFAVRESVQPKLGGVIVLIEGKGAAKAVEGGEGKVGHDALAVVSFDPESKTYRFHHYTMQGASGEDELVLTEKGMSWELKSANLPFRMRFLIEIDGDTWHEYGETSRDGERWTRNMEMTLKRIQH